MLQHPLFVWLVVGLSCLVVWYWSSRKFVDFISSLEALLASLIEACRNVFDSTMSSILWYSWVAIFFSVFLRLAVSSSWNCLAHVWIEGSTSIVAMLFVAEDWGLKKILMFWVSCHCGLSLGLDKLSDSLLS